MSFTFHNHKEKKNQVIDKGGLRNRIFGNKYFEWMDNEKSSDCLLDTSALQE